MERKSKTTELLKELRILEQTYNNLNNTDEVRVIIKGSASDILPDWIITEEEMLTPIYKYFANRINKVKKDLQKEFKKELF